MAFKIKRIKLEKKTVGKMIALYCRKNHKTADKTLCPDCQSLHDYSQLRLDRCIFQDNKPNCSHCTIHCYKPDMRVKIKEVMRFSGPRMILRNPILALLHSLDGIIRRKSD
ncbi:nitrous oxide-stimulated promoter family protein [Candidatus Magnetomonas plexicatena]|uniref:nitrous oxide-stimulated promoter family protein n=1 Tax=Candidatus Magnetomonas plexicatena TaxID=2552947 RepID=UPI004032FE87